MPIINTDLIINNYKGSGSKSVYLLILAILWKYTDLFIPKILIYYLKEGTQEPGISNLSSTVMYLCILDLQIFILSIQSLKWLLK